MTTQGITPHIVVNNGLAAIDWYKKIFNAEQKEVKMADDGIRVLHSELVLPNGSTFMLVDDFPEYRNGKKSAPSIDCLSPVTLALFFQGDEGEIFWKRITEKNKDQEALKQFTVTMEFAEQFWNAQYGSITDPFGHSWSISAPSKNNKKRKITETELDNKNNNNNNTCDYTQSKKCKTENDNKSGFIGVEEREEKCGLFITYLIGKDTGYNFFKASQEGFKKLSQHINLNNLKKYIQTSVAICPDDPRQVDPCRYILGFILDTNSINLKEFETDEIKIQVIPKGHWYIYIHKGSCDQLSNSWESAISGALKQGYKINGYCYENYIDDFNQVPQDQLRIEICIPVQKID